MLLRRLTLQLGGMSPATILKIVRFNNSMFLCQFLLDFENYYV